MIEIRPAREADLPAINDIYNDAVAHTTASFDLAPLPIEQRSHWWRIRQRDGRHPVLVASEGGQIVGWAALNAWSTKQAYERTVENSVYVAADRRGNGIGRGLLEALLAAARAADVHVVLARITSDNAASLHLHRALGFEDVGVMRQVGQKFGRYLDVAVLQLIVD